MAGYWPSSPAILTSHLVNNPGIFITIQHISASDSITEAEVLAAKYRNTTPTLLDVTESEEKLNKLIQQHDVVIR